MKKAIIFLSLIGLSACAGTGKLSKDGQDEKAFVAEFVRLMIEDKASDYLRNYISPNFYLVKDIKASDYQVNSFLPYAFEMESYDPKTGVAQVIIKGQDAIWVHRLYFQVVKEAGKLYLMPEKVEDHYIDPWYEADRFLEDDSY